jgi:hypothetical protein
MVGAAGDVFSAKRSGDRCGNRRIAGREAIVHLVPMGFAIPCSPNPQPSCGLRDLLRCSTNRYNIERGNNGQQVG